MWYTQKQKTDKELQDELKAFCQVMEIKNYLSFADEKRYEALLFEIYSRNLIPCTTLTKIIKDK